MHCYINEQCYTNVGQNIRINTASIFFFFLIIKNNFHINNWIDKMDLHKEELKNSTVQPQNKAWSNRNSIHIKSWIRHAWADQSFGYKCSSYKNSLKRNRSFGENSYLQQEAVSDSLSSLIYQASKIWNPHENAHNNCLLKNNWNKTIKSSDRSTVKWLTCLSIFWFYVNAQD